MGKVYCKFVSQQKAKHGIARNLKAAGLTAEQIKAATGLTDTDLEQL